MSETRTKGYLVSIDGIDGAGKSSHLAWLADNLRARGHEVLVTREPGGTELGEKLREMLLHAPMHPDTETLLMFAARAEHLHKVIRPALAAGTWVLCDRFTDATFAYQGGGKGLSFARLAILEQWVQEGLQPDLTFLFDVPEEVARQRRERARAADKFEQEREDFFQRVRDTYLARARQDPGRIRVIDSNRPMDVIREELAAHLDALGRP